MFEWNLKDMCKIKLSEEDGSSILGECMLKKCFLQLSLRKKVLKQSFSIKLII